MAETGVPKFVSMKNIGWVIGVIVIVIAIFVAWRYIRAVFVEYIDVPTKGEKARFMRYMGCAIAMCEAPGDEEDGCYSDKVMDWVVEYDEGGNAVEGCQQVCFDVRDQAGGVIQKHYCGEDYAINFTFQYSATYIGNYSISGSITDIGKNEVSCGVGKTGWQTDASCTGGWEKSGILDCGCLQCRGGKRPTGKLVEQIGDCERGDINHPGAIWIPESLVTGGCTKWDGHTIGTVDQLAWCNFEEGEENSIYIWTEDPHHSDCNCVWSEIDIYGIIGWSGCICAWFVADHYCPQIVICDHEP